MKNVGVSGDSAQVSGVSSAGGLPVCTHGCHTGLNMAASVGISASIDCVRYFEGDGSADIPSARSCAGRPTRWQRTGTVLPLEGAGLGVEIDENFVRASHHRGADLE